MPVSYSPDLRLKELEQLLLNTMHYPEGCQKEEYKGVWTPEELAEKISELFDLKKTISTKTIVNNLKKMEVDYNAPIDKKDIYVPSWNGKANGKNVKKVGYFYYDTTKTIFSNNNLSQADLKNLRTVVDMLKQFKGFKYFEDVDVLVDKLELKASKNNHASIIFETIDEFTGLEHIDIIASAIKNSKVLKIKYQPFYESKPVTYTIHPYQLREYNNRWFVLAHTEEFEERKLGIYGLSRITEEPKLIAKTFIKTYTNLVKTYFKDIIGVTNFLDNKVEHIVFEAYGMRANYIKTKPWHPSQQIVSETADICTFSLDIKINNELIALILQFGLDIKILEPASLQNTIVDKLKKATELYD
jgi:predicted DNA-binding transcriptional regulator YafY